jgi:hypothetical protein
MVEIVAHKDHSYVLANYPDSNLGLFTIFADSSKEYVPGTKIKTIRKGLVKKVDGQWIIVKEPVIVFGEITQELKEEYGNKSKDNSKEISVLKTKLADIYKKYDAIISPLLEQVKPFITLTEEEADWLYDNLKLITKTYNSDYLANSADIELKEPLIIGDTKVTHIEPDPGDESSIIFERPSGKWMVKISEKNGEQRLTLSQWRDANVKGEFSFYGTNDSRANDLKNIEKAGLMSLINSIYKDTNVPYPDSRLEAFELRNSLQQKYNLKRSYKDIINELKQPVTNTTADAIDKNFDTIIQQLENSGLFENSQKQFKQCK